MQKHPDIDIILMDIPVMNGYEAIKENKEFNEDVIIITQALSFTVKLKNGEVGGNGYISKPINKKPIN
jgi:CheY-like chemotaxis protein